MFRIIPRIKKIAHPGFYRLSYQKVSESSLSFTRINVNVQLLREFNPEYRPGLWVVQVVNDFGRKQFRVFMARIVNQPGGELFLKFYAEGVTPLTTIGGWTGRGNEYGVIRPLTMIAPTLKRSRPEYEQGTIAIRRERQYRRGGFGNKYQDVEDEDDDDEEDEDEEEDEEEDEDEEDDDVDGMF